MDIQEVWSRLLQTLKSYPEINPSQIDAFFSRIRIQAVSPGFIMLTSDNSFIKNWIELHYISDIKRALEENYHVDFEVLIEIDTTAAEASDATSGLSTQSNPIFPEQSPAQDAHSAEYNNPTQQFSSPEINSEGSQPSLNQKSNFASSAEIFPPQATSNHEIADQSPTPVEKSENSRLTFNSFVIGESNRFAYNMAIEVAEKPGNSSLNPLFFYGKSGVGKTHLMCAIKNYIEKQYPNLNVIYMDSTELVNRYSDASRENSFDKQSFKNFDSFFDTADVFLLDDIQGLQGKTETLGALFRIFNNNIIRGKQFVFSADRAPKHIDLDERYISRFISGAVIDIQPPDDETKRNIIKNFVQQYQKDENINFEISDDILDYIVEESGTNIREIQSAITSVIFAIKMQGDNQITPAEVKDMLANHFLNKKGARYTIENVQSVVERFYHITHADLVSPKRSQSIANARHVACYLTRVLLNTTFVDIGKAFNRDHASVMHSCRLIENKLKEDRNLREEMEIIRKMLKEQDF